MALLSVAVEHTSPDNQPEAIPYCCSDVLSVVWTDLAVVFPHNITQRLQPTGGAQDSFLPRLPLFSYHVYSFLVRSQGFAKAL